VEQIRVLLADDHKIILEGLRGLLEGQFSVVGTVEDGRELLAKAEQLRPDVIVVDITMPFVNGIDAVEQLKKSGCQAKVVFLTMHPDALYARRAFDAGGSGYVLKHSAPQELVTAIREAVQGRMYVTPMVAEGLMQSYKADRPGEKGNAASLTSRQKEVLRMLAEGKSAKEIATALQISKRTVEFHKYHTMEILGISNTAELIQYAIKQGLVTI
jgi:DNA-binding NarL/FixJ family response regulator